MRALPAAFAIALVLGAALAVPPAFVDHDEDGYSAYRIEQITSGEGFRNAQPIEARLAAWDPAIVTVHAGTNDAQQDFFYARHRPRSPGLRRARDPQRRRRADGRQRRRALAPVLRGLVGQRGRARYLRAAGRLPPHHGQHRGAARRRSRSRAPAARRSPRASPAFPTTPYPDAACSQGTCQLSVGFVSSIDGGASWSKPKTLAGPMALADLANTNQGFMVGDDISTSFSEANAMSVFALAKPKSGSKFHEARWSTSRPVTAAQSYPLQVGDDPVVSTQGDRARRAAPLTTR
jgi:hypothetical protein